MKWLEIKNKSAASADLYLYDEIGGWGTVANDVRAEIQNLDTKQINLFINSPGGSVFEGFAIYNLLKNHKARVVAYVDGIAASIASVILCAADEVVMRANGMVMIHDPAGGRMGNATEQRKLADTLDKITDSIVQAYRTRTGKAEAEIRQLMAAETWFTASESVTFGFGDRVEGEVKAVAKFDLTGFKRPPPVAQAGQSLLDQALALKGQEQIAFYRQHKRELDRQMERRRVAESNARRGFSPTAMTATA